MRWSGGVHKLLFDFKQTYQSGFECLAGISLRLKNLTVNADACIAHFKLQNGQKLFGVLAAVLPITCTTNKRRICD